MKEFTESNVSNVSRKWFQTTRFHPYGRIVFIASLYLHPTEQSQHQIFGIRTEQNETQNTCKRKYMSEILDNKILRLLNILMTKTRFPSKVENITFS